MNLAELRADEKSFEMAVSVFAKRFKFVQMYESDKGGTWPYKVLLDSFMFTISRQELQYLDVDAIIGVMLHCRDRGLINLKDTISSKFYSQSTKAPSSVKDGWK